MKVSEIMNRNVVSVSPTDTVYKALKHMSENRIHQLPVVDDSLFVGMVTLKDCLGSKSTVESVMVRTPSLEMENSLETAISKLLESGLRGLPVVDGNEVRGMVSETDLIKHIEFLKDIDVEHFQSPVATVSEKDSIKKALSIMSQKNISRVVVADANVKGVLDNLSVAGFLSQPSQSVRAAEYTSIEKESLANFKIGDFVRETRVMQKNEFSLKQAIRFLQDYEEVVVVDKNNVIGVITPKDILELRDYEELPLQVSNYRMIDRTDMSRINDKLAEFMKKVQKMANVQRMFVYFDTISENGRMHHFVRARLIAANRTFVAQSDAWTLEAAVRGLMGNMEKQFQKFHDKIIKSKRMAHRKMKEM